MAEFNLGSDFERFQQEMQKQMGDVTKMQDAIKEAVGRGETAEGRVVAEYRSEGGLTKLELDPRAMRLSADELSEEIRVAVNDAARDFQTKVREASSAMFDMPNDPNKGVDPTKALASLDKIANGFAGQLSSLAKELGVQQQRAQEAMQNYKGPGSPGGPR